MRPCAGSGSFRGKEARMQVQWSNGVPVRMGLFGTPVLAGADHPEVVEEALSSIVEVARRVKEAGGHFQCVSAYRSFEEQRDLRRRWEVFQAYEKAMAEGKRWPGAVPPKQAYTATPGSSWHNAGRAVDLAVRTWRDGRYRSTLGFPVPEEQHVQALWNIMRPIGWEPIIRRPSLDQSECWHFEFLGCWATAARSDYRNAVRAACADIGGWPEQGRLEAFVQAQLLRLGKPVQVDGVIGPKTRALLAAEGVGDGTDLRATAEALTPLLV